jgi:hypothetical protein
LGADLKLEASIKGGICVFSGTPSVDISFSFIAEVTERWRAKVEDEVKYGK